MLRLFLFFLLILNLSLVFSESLHNFKILRVIDGDTLVIEANYLPEPLKPELKLKIIGVDTPEKGSRAKCDEERILSNKAKSFVERQIKIATNIHIKLDSWDKYGGRVLGDVILDGKSLKNELLNAKLAKYYDGGKKSSWCRNK